MPVEKFYLVVLKTFGACYLTTKLEQLESGQPSLSIFEQAAVASMEASYACEDASTGAAKQNPEKKPANVAVVASKAWKRAGFAWDVAARTNSPPAKTIRLNQALEATADALSRTCNPGLSAAYMEALLAWEAAKEAWNSHDSQIDIKALLEQLKRANPTQKPA